MREVPARLRPEFYLAADGSSLSRTLPCDVRSVAVARRLVIAALDRWELPQDLVDRAELVVSELATNAVVHARTRGGSIRVGVSRVEDDGVQVATDTSVAPLGVQGGQPRRVLYGALLAGGGVMDGSMVDRT